MSRSPYRQEIVSLLHLAWPIMGAQILTLGMVFTDNVMVARLGEKPLAAMAMAGTIYSTCYILAMGILSALSPAISHAYGAKDSVSIGRWIRQGTRLSFVLSSCVILVLINSKNILVFLGQDPELAAVAQTFLRALAWGVPGQYLYFCGRTLSEGTSDSRPSIYIAAIGVLANIGLDYLLIYGKLGFPAWGVAGAGYATSLINWIMAGAMGLYLKGHARYKDFGIFDRGPWFEKNLVRDFIRIGLPISGGMLAEMCFFAGATLLMGTLGSEKLAAHQIAINAASLTFMIPLGLAFAVGIRVGQFRGRGDNLGMVRAGRAGFLVTLLMQCLPGGLFLLFPEVVTSLYTSDPALTERAVALLRVGGIFQIFDGLQVVGISALRGLRDTKIPFLNTVISFWLLGAPLAIFLMKRIGPVGVWYGMVIGLGLASAFHLLRFQRLSRDLVQ